MDDKNPYLPNRRQEKEKRKQRNGKKKKSILKVPIMYKLPQKIKREKITQLIV